MVDQNTPVFQDPSAGEQSHDANMTTKTNDETAAVVINPPKDHATNTVPAPATQGHSEDPEASRTKLQTWLIMLALCSGLFLAALDVTIVSTAAPTMAADLKSSSSGYTWIGST
jgi:hypothetical protein